MCGIFGSVGVADKNLLKKMAGSLWHRGPDSEGMFFEDGVGLGVRRLSIIDLKTGDQPIFNEDKTIVIVFNGEIYNFRELRNDLEKKGHRFYTLTDTEVIVHLYEEHKEDCVNFLNGMFAFAIWDKAQKKLFIARDRLGVKPLYYAVRNGELIFSSELKALLEDGSISREIDLEALDCYLRFLYIPAPLTIFKGVYKLLAGHNLIWEKGRIETERYWEVKSTPKRCLCEGDFVEQTRDLFKEAVRLRLISDVPLGVFLSGGIDSSAIVAMMRQIGCPQIKTFSIGYDKEYNSYNELDDSRLVADHFKTDHQEFIVRPEIIKLLPKIAWHLDEPFGDSSAILTYLISHEAKKFVTVALSGIGGDEIFGGYPRYIGAGLSLYYQRLPFLLRKALSHIHTKDSRGRIERFVRNGALSMEDRYINWISVFKDETLNSLYSGFVKEGLRNKVCDIHKGYLNQGSSLDYLDRIFYLDVNTYLVDDLLFMGDRMSMANSLELRVPFCDHRLVEFAASIPNDLKIRRYCLKSLFKKSLKGILPERILNKKKQGFMVPIGEWFKKPLKDYIREVLSEENIRKRGYFDPAYIHRMLNDHFNGRRLYTHQIWSLLMLELWSREFIDKHGR